MGDNVSAILEGLNSEQKKAVGCVDGPVLIVAGAGSGKTRVLTSRIAYIIAGGCDPSRILSLTFTKKAASEMKERVAALVGGRNAWKIQMGTFHSVFIRFLRDYAESLGYPKDFTIYDTGDSTSLVKTILKEMGLNEEKSYKPKDVLSRISSAKNALVGPSAYRANPKALQNDVMQKRPKMVDIYQNYWDKCRKAGVMDFDDILFNMNILLKNNKEAQAEIASRFDYIMVDEYQDTNRAQYIILRQLCVKHHNICVVGDDSQSIYAFRGARIENILNFKKDYPEAKVFKLEQNYRSTKVIVNAANSLIAKNEDRIPKVCYSEGEEGEKIRLVNAYTDKEEATLIASEIIGRIQSDKAEYQDFAILYRTNSQSRALEEQLRRRNIPYMIYSGNSFFDRAEVKDTMAYFKLVINNNDDESFKRCVNNPGRGIGDKTVERLTAAAAAAGCSLLSAAYLDNLAEFGMRDGDIVKIRQFCDFIRQKTALNQTDAYDVARSVTVESGLLGMYQKDTSIEGQSRLANIEELLNSVKSYVDERHNDAFEEMQMDASSAEGLPEDFQISESDLPVVTLGEFLENVSLLSAVDVSDDEDTNNKVALMTVHSSKGLEFPYVFVVGMEENIFPSGGSLAGEAEIQEERRLFYVALTRAEKAVVITFATTRMRNGKTETNSPSRFIREIDSRYVSNPLPKGAQSQTDDDVPVWGRRSVSVSGAGRFSGKPMYGGSFSRGSGPAVTERRPASSQQQSRPAPPLARGPLGKPVAKPAASLPEVDFIPSPVSELKPGCRVQHNRFGYGVIREISGSVTALQARISFDQFGEKILVLKYAKLRVVGD